MHCFIHLRNVGASFVSPTYACYRLQISLTTVLSYDAKCGSEWPVRPFAGRLAAEFGVISLNAVALGKVVAGTKQLDVCCSQRRSTLGKWKNVVKVQFVRCTANRTLSSIAFPDCKFYGRRNQPAAFSIHMNGLSEVFLSFYGNEFEFAHNSKFISLKPSIEEMEYAIV